VEALRFTPRDTQLPAEALDAIAEYWQAVRQFYRPFESENLPATSDLYRHEMPGGQYTNLYQQAQALGLAHRWPEICRMYAEVNQMFGDIVKVTPTSKAVGDMALFMVANQLTADDILHGDRELSFPESVVDLLSGKMGQVEGGFPKRLQERIVGQRPIVQGRPGAVLPPADLDQAADRAARRLGRSPTRGEVLSYVLYPKVFEQFAQHRHRYGDTSVLPTPVFFYGMMPGEEIAVDIEPGKTLIIKFLTVGDLHPDGTRTVFFELNGQPREVTIIDKAHQPESPQRPKADPQDPLQVGASMPGMVANVAVQVGDGVRRGQKLLTLEAMKMQTNVMAECEGRVAEILVRPGDHVATGDLLMRLDNAPALQTAS